MSEITEALQRIEAWLQNHMPNRAAELKPGLTRDEIDELVKDLPFSLPEEVYELYQWHDGSVDRFVFVNYNFFSLNDAIEAYYEWWAGIFSDKDEEAYFFEKSFPIFELWSDCGVILSVVCEDSNNYPVRMLDVEYDDYFVRYRSLKNLILHLADWYESAQSYEDENLPECGVEEERKYLLDVKYMAKEYITYVANKDSDSGGLRQQIYQRYLNGDISLSDI
jgi:hypothetical protein